MAELDAAEDERREKVNTASQVAVSQIAGAAAEAELRRLQDLHDSELKALQEAQNAERSAQLESLRRRLLARR